MAEHRYLWDHSDDTLCRLRDGIVTEVWQPRAGRWVSFDFNPWTQTVEVTVQKARA